MDPVGEYLEKNPSVSAYLKDAVSLLLECRPADPVTFLAEYFATPGASRSYRFLRLSKRCRATYWDHTLAAYMALEGDSGVGITCADFKKLMLTVCGDFPGGVAPLVLSMHDKCETACRGPCTLTFHEFAAAANASLLCGTLLRQVDELLRSVDVSGTGSVPRAAVLSLLQGPSAPDAAEAVELCAILMAMTTKETVQAGDIVAAILRVCDPYDSGGTNTFQPEPPAPHVELVSPLWSNPMGRVVGSPAVPRPRHAFVRPPNVEGRYLLPS